MEPGLASTRRALAAVTVSAGVVGFTTTAITVGTRGMARDLSLSTAQLGWVVNAYLVAAAALVLVGARLGDVLGRVRTFALGLVLFAAASVLGTVAGGFGTLVTARIGQGVGAALVLPAGIELVTEYARAGKVAADLRWRGLVYAISFAVGPLVGGVLTDWLSWRWIFVLDVAVVGVVVVLALPLRHHPGWGRHEPTHDLVGAVLFALLVAVVVVVAESATSWTGLGTPLVAAVLLAGGLTVALVHHERRTAHPLMHPSILGDRLVLGANVATVGASLGMLSLLYFFNLFAQSAVLFDEGVVGVLLALGPFIGSMVLCALFAHWLGDRLGPRGPAIVGLALMVIGFGVLSTTTAGTTKTELAVPLALAGLGAGIANASLTSIAVLRLPAGRVNEAAGWISLSRFFGSAMALALGTAAFLSVTSPVVGAETPVQPPGPSSAFETAVATLDRDLSGPFLAALQSASAERFSRSMLVTAVVLAVALVASAWLLRPPRVTDRARDARR